MLQTSELTCYSNPSWELNSKVEMLLGIELSSLRRGSLIAGNGVSWPTCSSSEARIGVYH